MVWALGATFAMAGTIAAVKPVTGMSYGLGATKVLDPVFIFKGKLRAAATRSKFHDSADLRWLETKERVRLQQHKNVFNLVYIGLALKRYPELGTCFTRIGLDITAAKAAAADQDPNKLPPPQAGDVQRGLLGPSK